jgi:hypothetical protein
MVVVEDAELQDDALVDAELLRHVIWTSKQLAGCTRGHGNHHGIIGTLQPASRITIYIHGHRYKKKNRFLLQIQIIRTHSHGGSVLLVVEDAEL